MRPIAKPIWQPLGRPLTRNGVSAGSGGGEGPAFDATTLFASGNGYLFDVTNSAGLFQAVNGTTAADANDDVVGYIADQSGGINHLVAAANDTSRPLLKSVGSNPYLQFDGSNDWIRTPQAISCNVAEWWWWFAGSAASGSIVAGTFGNAFQYSRLDLTQFLVRPEGTTNNVATAAFSSITSDAVFLVRHVQSTRACTVYRNGVEYASLTAAATNWFNGGNNAYAIGAGLAASGPSAAKFYCGGLIDRALSSEEQSNLNTWMATRAGVSL